MGMPGLFLRLRQAKAWRSDMTPDVFGRHADFLMGPGVYNVPMLQGVAYRVPWNIILGYELKVRREACKNALEDNVTLAAAIGIAYRDTYLCDVHLAAPATWSSSASGSGGSKGADGPNNEKGRGRGGKGKSPKKG
eukprot:3286011-Karenia_brevis.AAC.1